ncbi:DUF4332 domain-containing protein [Hyphomicrobium methylovorum]|uniref:DUF4332 domain-containing protein n=1 Tax=Hyphomicrobium methylovorum TaxID=84 RepID=UPI0015E6A692|nr:DUF4332 domain-containing protein [Hyphomicrobium methylovorum]MBA2127103.1 DUF4332 domain-containing protein [Hyphomicrobium methylovorum]
MSPLFRIVYATHANGTHHKLALDALSAMNGPARDAWTRVFLKHVERYLEGSKAPDVTFKDFKNHVLHVSDKYWGGAPEKAEAWYRQTVAELKSGNWTEAVYSAGVLSHYFTDPIMPFHTAQTEAENAIHRATEWSINRSYNVLRALGETRFPDLDAPRPSGPKWLSEYVCDGAEFSHRYYEKLIAHYDIHKGATHPEDGLDDIAKGIVAELLIYAAKSFGHVLDAAIAEAGVAAPDVPLTAETFLAITRIPQKFIEKRLSNAEDRKLVASIYDELRKTGRVDKSLPEDDRAIRDLHAKEVLEPQRAQQRQERAKRIASSGTVPARQTPPAVAPVAATNDATSAGDMALQLAVAKSMRAPSEATARPPAIPPVAVAAATPAPASAPAPAPAPAREVPAKAPTRETPAPVKEVARLEAKPAPEPVRDQKRYLIASDDLEAAPSIGPKTAERFAEFGIYTVEDFLGTDATDLADEMDNPNFDAETLYDWQDQARLVIDIPGLRGTHAQLLVGAGYRTAHAVADADPVVLSADVLKFASTSDGKRVLREGRPPDIEKIKGWVDFARLAVAA